MKYLKADFHTHSSDDPRDEIAYSAESLIDAAAAKGIEVLALTCHGARIYDPYLAEYARHRGILLIPGIEANINGCHVLILNPDEEQARASTYEDLRRLGPRNAAIIAPHPFYPAGSAVQQDLIRNADVFHAVEISGFYFLGVNFNRKAERVARKLNLPLVGNSDTHVLPYVDNVHTRILAEPAIESVIEALRSGRVEVVAAPRPLRDVANMMRFAVEQFVRDRQKVRQNGGLYS